MNKNLVVVKTKHQITLPSSVRKQIGIEVGDILEVSIEKNKITLSPKNLVDQSIARGLDDIKHGRVSKAMTASEAVEYLHSLIKKSNKR